MTTNNYVPINFSISSSTWSEMEEIRIVYDRNSSDKADVAVVGWGTTILNDGNSWSGVVVSFYGISERPKIQNGIQYLDGREVVFFITEELSYIFSGKTLKFESDKGFYLS